MNQSITSRDPMFLLGETSDTISVNKLPSNKQILKLLYYCSRRQKTPAASYSVVIDEVCKFWCRAGIPVKRNHQLVKLLKKLHCIYRNLQKSSNLDREKEFSECLEKLFDIAHGDA